MSLNYARFLTLIVMLLFAFSLVMAQPPLKLSKSAVHTYTLESSTAAFKAFCIDPVKKSADKDVAYSSHKAVTANVSPRLLRRAAWIAQQTHYSEEQRQAAIWELMRGAPTIPSLAGGGSQVHALGNTNNSADLVFTTASTVAIATIPPTSSNRTSESPTRKLLRASITGARKIKASDVELLVPENNDFQRYIVIAKSPPSELARNE